MIKGKGLGFNHTDLLYRAISIAPYRDKYFMDLIDQYQKRYPGMKLIYANNTVGDHVKIKSYTPMADFILIFRVMTNPTPTKKPSPFIILECPLQFSDRSLAGWTMAVEDNNMDGYFNFMIDTATRLTEEKFKEYIEYITLLSLDKDDPRYWKLSNNSESFTGKIMQLCAQYNPSKPGLKIQQSKDYVKRK